MAARLSLCMIVRDNEKIITDCLTSIRPWVDEMIVVDTGSADATPEIARSLGAKLYFFPWCDSFAAARNESLKHATGDWLFWMDSDDIISAANGEKLRSLAYDRHPDRLLGHVMQVHCVGSDGREVTTVVDHVKVVRNHPAIRFEGRIHEQVLLSIRRLGGEVCWTDLFVTHSGSDHSPEGRRKKLARDMKLLELELIDHPDHPFCLFNFGMTYLEMGEARQAAEYLRRCLAVTQPDESHRRKAYALLLSSLGQSQAWEEAVVLAKEAFANFPDDPEISFRQGMALHGVGRLSEAVVAYRRALQVPKERFFCSVDPGLSSFKARHNLGIVFQEQKRFDLAELQWRLAVEERPSHEPSLIALGDVLLRQGKLATAALEAAAWTEEPVTRAAGLLLEADLLVARGQRAAAVEQLGAAVQACPGHLPLHQAYCQRLFESGRWPQAKGALSILTRQQPDDPAAHHNLGIAYLQCNEPAAAVAAFECSLALRPAAPATRQYLTLAQEQLRLHAKENWASSGAQDQEGRET